MKYLRAEVTELLVAGFEEVGGMLFEFLLQQPWTAEMLHPNSRSWEGQVDVAFLKKLKARDEKI